MVLGPQGPGRVGRRQAGANSTKLMEVAFLEAIQEVARPENNLAP